MIARLLAALLLVMATLSLPATAMAAAAAPGELPSPEASGDEAEGVIDDVLARPEFRDDRTLLERAREWVFERIGRAFDEVLSAEGGGLLGWVLAAVALAAVVFFTLRLTRGVRRDPGLTVFTPGAARRPPADWRAEAEGHEAAGEWRAALRCRYRALVAELAARGLVEEVPGRTAGEYRREVDVAVPAARGEFSGATDLFEEAWYGDRSTTPDDNQRFRQLADRVLSEAR